MDHRLTLIDRFNRRCLWIQKQYAQWFFREKRMARSCRVVSDGRRCADNRREFRKGIFTKALRNDCQGPKQGVLIRGVCHREGVYECQGDGYQARYGECRDNFSYLLGRLPQAGPVGVLSFDRGCQGLCEVAEEISGLCRLRELERVCHLQLA